MSCVDTSILPFFNEIPLNSILVVLLIDSNSRRLLEEQLKNWNIVSTNPLKSFIKLFLGKLKEDRTLLKKLYGFIKPLDLVRSLEPINYKREFWYNDYITKVLRMTEANFLLLIHDGIRKETIIAADTFNLSPTSSLTPDFIVLYHSALNTNAEYYISEYQELLKKDPKEARKLNLSNYDFEFKGLDLYEDEITFNNNNYQLSSCMITNKLGTTGFICDSKKFVYNYWANSTACSLVEYDWSLKVDSDDSKCFSKDSCKITEESCFSFKSDNRLLIYTKKEVVVPPLPKPLSSKRKDYKEELKEFNEEEELKIPKPLSSKRKDYKEELKELKELKEEPIVIPKVESNDTKDYIIKLLVKQLKEKEKEGK